MELCIRVNREIVSSIRPTKKVLLITLLKKNHHMPAKEQKFYFYIFCLGLIHSQSFRPDLEIMIWQLCQCVIAFVKLETVVVNYQNILKAFSCLRNRSIVVCCWKSVRLDCRNHLNDCAIMSKRVPLARIYAHETFENSIMD